MRAEVLEYGQRPDYEPGGTMISGIAVKRPTKEQLANDIANHYGLPSVQMSSGSTVVSTLLDDISRAETGSATGAADTYRKAEAVLGLLDLRYDPYWDTSESSPTGGGTVTSRAYSRIRTAVTGIPRCFILNSTDAPVGARWETDPRSSYRYDTTVSGHKALNDAGPGSRVLIYSTSRSSRNKMAFVAEAEVSYIGPGWDGPWEARLTRFVDFPTPVRAADVEIVGWNRQNAITEIEWSTFTDLVAQSGTTRPRAHSSRPDALTEEVVVARLEVDFPVANMTVKLNVPDRLPGGVLEVVDPTAPQYTLSGSEVVGSVEVNFPSRSSKDRAADRVAEARAVELAIQALRADGWMLVADRQSDGVGYDLDFASRGRLLHVEVKGIQGSKLQFNLTPKERWRAATDPDWVVVAVTSVLSPTSPRLHLVTRDRIASAKTVVTGYRVRL